MTKAIVKARALPGLTIIYFPGGTYHFNNEIHLSAALGDSNIVFMGTNAGTTNLVFDVGANNSCFRFEGFDNGDKIHLGTSTTITKGSKTISGVTFNNLPAWVDFYEFWHPQANETYFEESVGQINYMTNNTTLKYEANKLFDRDLYIRSITPIKNIGIELLRINRADQAYGNGSNIEYKYAVNCWVNAIESDNTSRWHIEVNKSSHITVQGSFFHDARSHEGGYGSGIILTHSTTNCLIENNIFRRLRHSMVAQGGANGNVFAYNYSRDRYWKEQGIEYVGTKGDLSLHGNYPFSNLFEHNYVEYIVADHDYEVYIWPPPPDGGPERQNGPYNALVRNKAMTDEGDPSHILLQHCPETAILGNDLDDDSPIYYEDLSTSSIEFYARDPYYNLLRHFEVEDYASDEYLDDVSYYYSAAPSFLPAGYRFPSIGPRAAIGESSGYGRVPASDRYATSQKYYNHNTTIIPPFVVEIDAPLSIPGTQIVTLTVVADDDLVNLDCVWEHRWIDTGGGGPIDPFGLTGLGGGGVIPLAPIGTWSVVGTSSEVLNFNVSADSEFRVTVSDGLRGSQTVYHSIDHPAGGVYDPSMANNTNFNHFNENEKGIKEISLSQNYPNPFNPTSTIKYAVPKTSDVKIEVFNIKGQRVQTLVDQRMGPGNYEAVLDGKNLASGIYIYRMIAGDFVDVKKMVLMK